MYYYIYRNKAGKIIAHDQTAQRKPPPAIEVSLEEFEAMGFYREPAPTPEPVDPPPTLEELRAAKLQEVGAACTAAIYAGIGVGDSHYSLTEHDQMEIMAQYTAVKEGTAAVPYHADGELCRMYTAEEFTALAQAATGHVFYHRTYCNHMNAWIKRADLEELAGITYGVPLPEDLNQSMLKILAEAEAEKTTTTGGGGTDAV